jgi:hypothetical protein
MNVLDSALKAAMVADTGTGKLAALSNGGFHQGKAPRGTAFNYTVFTRLLRSPVYAFGNVERAKHFFYQIVHFSVDGANNTTTSGQEAAGLMADRAVVYLTNPSLNVSGQTVLSCRFDRSIPDGDEWDEANDRLIYSKGGIYEVWLS